MPGWLVTSIVLSVALTVVLNVVLRAFPGAGRRSAERFARRPAPGHGRDDARRPRVQVFVPWKAMLVASLLGTLLLNLLVRLI